MFGLSFIANFLLSINGPQEKFICTRGLLRATTGFCLFSKSLRTGPEQLVADSTKHSPLPDNVLQLRLSCKTTQISPFVVCLATSSIVASLLPTSPPTRSLSPCRPTCTWQTQLPPHSQEPRNPTRNCIQIDCCRGLHQEERGGEGRAGAGQGKRERGEERKRWKQWRKRNRNTKKEQAKNIVKAAWTNTEKVRNIEKQSKQGLLFGTIWSTMDRKTSENGQRWKRS